MPTNNAENDALPAMGQDFAVGLAWRTWEHAVTIPGVTKLVLDMPEGALAALRLDPERFAVEMRLAAAAKWYEMQWISQERAAEIAGLSRAEFMTALTRFGVTPFQQSVEDLAREARPRT